MTNKFTGEPAGYGFVNFDSDQKAIYVMHRLGGKVIPNSNPPVRFKLNHNSTRLAPGEPDTSIWVGDLTPEVDDFALYQFFTARYQYVRCAKVVLDENGFSKGYGFVRFGMEAEQQHALANMTGKLKHNEWYGRPVFLAVDILVSIWQCNNARAKRVCIVFCDRVWRDQPRGKTNGGAAPEVFSRG